MVVVIVFCADLVWYRFGVVVIDCATLVFGSDTFIQQCADEAVFRQLKFYANKAVFPAVLKEKLGVVLKKVVVVDAQFGALIFITKAEQA